jgi:NitT/TauT family transport system permease protein
MLVLYRSSVLLVLTGLWWASSMLAGPNLVPTPWATFAAALTLFGGSELQPAIGSTLAVYFSGYLLATVVGVAAGLALGGFRVLGQTLEIYINGLMATPRVAFVPLIILLLGLGFKAKVAIVFLGAVLPILVNTYSGVINCDPELIEMARSVGSSRPRIFISILLPGAASSIAVGLRLGAAIGLINTIVAELYTALSGLGGLLTIYGNTFQMAPYFVVILVLAAIGMMTMQALKLLERRAERWRDGSG